MTQEERTKKSRALILDAAAKEFATHGYNHASVNRICERGHISKGRMFHHFKDKDDIFVGTYELFYTSLIEHMKNFTFSEDEPLEEVLDYFFNYRQEYLFSNPYLSVFMRNNILSVPEINRKRCAEIRAEFWEKEEAILGDIIEKVYPDLKGENKDMVVKIFGIASSYVHFNVNNQVFEPDRDMSALRESNRRVFSRVINIMLNGIYPRD